MIILIIFLVHQILLLAVTAYVRSVSIVFSLILQSWADRRLDKFIFSNKISVVFFHFLRFYQII